MTTQRREPETIRHQSHRGWSAFARWLASATGSGWAAAVFVAFLAVWTAVGFATGFPRWWELILSVGVPTVWFAELVVIQHTQNHDNLAMQLKLDELLRAIEGSSNAMIRLEEVPTEELERLQEQFQDESRKREHGRVQKARR